jgi:hypothetical protein
VAQLTLPDIQISMAEKAFRGYIKLIGDTAYYRIEESLTPNEVGNHFILCIRIKINTFIIYAVLI